MQKELEKWISKLWMSELLSGKCKRPGKFLGKHRILKVPENNKDR